ncbi:hypothetical protein PQQ96_38165 [Paraburkholderia sediminicola]|uniref:hypothetical protein n=1 Tax=Paraburkholderia sediminicola TaxID=458836 RepID=UPI0038BAECC2
MSTSSANGTTLTLAGNQIAIRLVNGGLRSVTGLIGKRNHDAVSFETPTGTIAVRGTNFGALFCQHDCGGVPSPNGSTPQNGLYVEVTQGAVVLSNPAGQQAYQAGQFGFVANLNSPPVRDTADAGRTGNDAAVDRSECAGGAAFQRDEPSGLRGAVNAASILAQWLAWRTRLGDAPRRINRPGRRDAVIQGWLPDSPSS